MTVADIARLVPVETEIARRGIKLRGKIEQTGPCPRCGGTDRFSINTAKQVWNCRGCARGGDVIELVMHLDSVDFGDACRSLIGEVKSARKPQPSSRVSNGLELWRAAAPMAGTLAETYLRRRGLDFSDPDGRVLRFHPCCPFGPGVTHPCMVGLFRSVITDEPVGIHRTALASDGRKIDRMALGRVGAAAIKLSADEEVERGLTIGEGIETTIAGMMLGFKPAWAVGFAGGIRAFPVLGGIECLTILVDHDAPDHNGRQAGLQAAQECSQRWTAAGREVQRVIPRRQGDDMADLAKEVQNGR
jgi:hypothetical protein